MTKFASSFALLVILASSAFAQIDAYRLRNKYGPPVDRETFTVRPGIEMIVDYGPSKQVCRIQLPSGAQYGGTIPEGAVTKRRIDEVLEEVVPPSVRGQQINQGLFVSGPHTVAFTDYEHVSISEVQNDGVGQGITVTFKDSACPKRNVP